MDSIFQIFKNVIATFFKSIVFYFNNYGEIFKFVILTNKNLILHNEFMDLYTLKNVLHY